MSVASFCCSRACFVVFVSKNEIFTLEEGSIVTNTAHEILIESIIIGVFIWSV